MLWVAILIGLVLVVVLAQLACFWLDVIRRAERQ